MIQFRKITEDNFAGILDMKAGGPRFVPPNAESLAQAWLYYENHDVYSFAIYDDDMPVGFMQLDEDLEKRVMYLWRVMIDEKHQSRGFGTAAVERIAALIKESGKYDRMELGCKPENVRGMHVYAKLGFHPTGEVEHGEVQMRLDFQKKESGDLL